MTMATFATPDARLFAGVEQTAAGSIAHLARRFADWRDYRRAVAELRALDMRQREDLGLDGRDMRDVARAALRRS
jgi:uncharacterized protein YjiS (DUF1127 family)